MLCKGLLYNKHGWHAAARHVESVLEDFEKGTCAGGTGVGTLKADYRDRSGPLADGEQAALTEHASTLVNECQVVRYLWLLVNHTRAVARENCETYA